MRVVYKIFALNFYTLARDRSQIDSNLPRKQSEEGNMITISNVKGNVLLWRSILAIHETKTTEKFFIYLYIVRKKNWKHIYHRVRSFIDLFCFIDVSLNIGRYYLAVLRCNKKHLCGRGMAILSDWVMPPFDGPAGARRLFRISIEVRRNIRSINSSKASS